VPDCAASKSLTDLPVFALGVSARGHVCWELPLTTPVADSHSFSQPLVSGGQAYFDADSDVAAVDLVTGHERWRWQSGDPLRVGGAPGGTETVAALDAVVIATQGTFPGQQFVVGLDQRTGAAGWRRPRPIGLGSGPLDSDDGGVVFTGYDGRVVEVLDDANGVVRWSRPAPPAPPRNGAVEVALLFASAGGNLIVAAPHGGIDAVSSVNGDLRWQDPGPVNTVVARAGVVLVTPPPGTPPAPHDVPTRALDPATGRALWSSTPDDPGGSVWSDPGGALMHIEYGPGQGDLARVDPTTGRTIWAVSTEAYATADGGSVIADTESATYQGGAESVVGRDPATGAVRWRTSVTTPNLIDVRFFATDGPAGRVLVIENYQQLIGINAATGALEWQLDLPADASVDGAAPAPGGLVVQASQMRYAVLGH
jgi:outer membrane protein assembly factor BamB